MWDTPNQSHRLTKGRNLLQMKKEDYRSNFSNL